MIKSLMVKLSFENGIPPGAGRALTTIEHARIGRKSKLHPYVLKSK